jgi:hypothetical protein
MCDLDDSSGQRQLATSLHCRFQSIKRSNTVNQTDTTQFFLSLTRCGFTTDPIITIRRKRMGELPTNWEVVRNVGVGLGQSE